MEQLEDKLYDEKDELETTHKKQPKNKKQFSEINETANGVIGWVEKILFLINKYGLKKIFQALLLIVACFISFLFIDAIREENIIKSIITTNDELHNEASLVRKEIDPKINKTLTRMLYSMDADRVGVLEMHNGKENPTSLPFLYCDMTYEETKENINYVSEEYENLNMSKFQFPTFLYQHKVFFGSIEDVMKIDKKLGLRLELNDVKYIGMVLIRTNVDIGFITISWVSEPMMTKDEIIADLIYYVQEVGTYLDYGEYKKINK